MTRIYHIATRADWLEATRTGTYRTSTAGRSLDEEGFIHASRREQVAGVFSRYYAKAGEPPSSTCAPSTSVAGPDSQRQAALWTLAFFTFTSLRLCTV